MSMLHTYWYSVHSSLKFYQTSFHTSSSLSSIAKRFKYPSWLFYDVEYRKWAAIHHIRNWSTTNPELYSLAFTGQALAINWCPICQVEGSNHTYL